MAQSTNFRKPLKMITGIALIIPLAATLLLHGQLPQPRLECTIAVIRPEQTTDGRIHLWKNRDVSDRNQVVHQGRGLNGMKYVGIGYGDDGDIVYGGVNEAGFAIINSNSNNIGTGNTGYDDDGRIQTLALKTCTTVRQFRRILDSTNTAGGGRVVPCNYIAFDSTGSISVFEAGRSSYATYPIDASYSYTARANYSLSGPAPTENSQWGFFRRKRAQQLISNQISRSNIRIDSMFTIARDIAPEGWTSLRYDYSVKDKVLDFSGSVCRKTTVSAIFIQSGKRTSSGWLPPVCWFMLGKPLSTTVVPVWPQQESVSSILTDENQSSSDLCNRANVLFDSATVTSTTILSQNLNAILNPILSGERARVNTILRAMTTPLSASNAQIISDSMAQYAMNTLNTMPFPNRTASLKRSLASNSSSTIPTEFSLLDAYPNPFNSATSVRVAVPYDASVRIDVVNSIGQTFETLYSGQMTAGWHNVSWQPKSASSGQYFVRLSANNHVSMKRVVYIK